MSVEISFSVINSGRTSLSENQLTVRIRTVGENKLEEILLIHVNSVTKVEPLKNFRLQRLVDVFISASQESLSV